MQVRFLGVRGSVAVSGARFAATGGNTSAVLLEHEGHRLVLDGGTGLAALGQEIGFQAVDVSVLFTHVHWDHIQGVPFFTPLFHPGSRVRFVGARTAWGGVADALAAQMRPPQFPIGPDAFAAAVSHQDARPGEAFDLGPFRVEATEMAHPDGVLVYKVRAGGRTVVFATDVEHGERLDPGLVDFAGGADLLIHDAQYTDAEYRGVNGPSRRGWGHSTWEDAVAVATRAGARRLALFHHDPTRDDAAVDRIAAWASAVFPGAFAARESVALAL